MRYDQGEPILARRRQHDENEDPYLLTETRAASTAQRVSVLGPSKGRRHKTLRGYENQLCLQERKMR